MSNKIIEYVIGAKDATGNAIRSAIGKIRSFAATTGTNLMNIKAGFEMLASSVRSFVSVFTKSISEAFKFEKAVANFKTLLGSIKESRKHIEDLRQFAASTPLTFDDLQQASKLLLSFGATVDSVMPSLKMLGDISMGDRQKFQGLALVFAQVKAAGKLMGQDLLQMINQGFNPLTVIAKESGKSVGELKDMMSAGAISFDMVAEAMRLATSEGGLFNNAMKDSATTGEGLFSTLEDNWLDAVRTFGAELTDLAKGGIQWCINKLQELKESGAIQEWAKNAKEAIYGVMGVFRGLSDSSTRDEAWSGLKDVVIGGFEEASTTAINLLKKAAPVIGALIAQGFTSLKDMLADMMSEAAARAVAQEQLGDSIYHTERGYAPNMQGQIIPYEKKVLNADADERINELARQIMEEQKRQKAEEVKMKAEEMSGLYADKGNNGESRFERGLNTLKDLGRRMAQEMSAIDSTSVSQNKKTESYKQTGDLKQMVDKAASGSDEKERLRIEKAIAKERERQWKEYVASVRRDLADTQKEQANANAALERATAKEQQAWGWYRDKDSLKTQLDEERANAEAEKQFEKDFERLKNRRYDWRTANEYGSGGMRSLSLDETAVKRVALAREEKESAAEYAQQTAEAAQHMSEVLDEINGAIAQGGE